MMTEEQYQYALRNLSPVRLVQIINKYRKELIFCCEIIESIKAIDIRHIREMTQELSYVIPEWYKLDK